MENLISPRKKRERERQRKSGEMNLERAGFSFNFAAKGSDGSRNSTKCL
jgi:hypothetical protein